ncbi:MAG: PilZ domain-containing protein [Candidatus Omnitrophota bacterium]|nr:PilZ domain-containing protein [Candidatus Omnitrophota bacterium]MDZ4243159.1 PilZ domain-containing protein [Candidatus Omnitrophota bacterium]
MSSVADKRYLPRWEVKNRINYQFEDDPRTYEAQSKDISCSGACLYTQGSLPVHQKIKMKIFLADDVAVKLDGQILWSTNAQGKDLAGIIFSDVSQQAQELILKHAFEIKKEDMVKYWFEGWDKK